jgi:SH3-like domain-containing protein
MIRTLIFLFAFMVWPTLLYAGTPQLGPSGLPLPRFVSLKSDEVNLRAGPGTRYPIEWVYKKASLPVEIIQEFDVWRRIRDFEGDEGWVQKMNLSGKRTAMIKGEQQSIKVRPSSETATVAEAEPGVVGALKSCTKDWCRLEFGDYEGYVQKKNLYGVLPDEMFD